MRLDTLGQRLRQCPGPPFSDGAARPPAAGGRPASGHGTHAAAPPAQMPRALVHHQHERDELCARAEAAAAVQLRHQPLEMRVEPELADELCERRQAASRSRLSEIRYMRDCPPPPEGRSPKGGGGQSRMYLNPDKLAKTPAFQRRLCRIQIP